jgi:hypothetical protein
VNIALLHLMAGQELEARRTGARGRPLDQSSSPVTRVTLRYSSAADAKRLRQLAGLDSAAVPSGCTLVAEVDGRLRAALPLDGSAPIADRAHGGADFLELLRVRASQLV